MIPKYLYKNLLKVTPYQAPLLPDQLTTPLYLHIYHPNSTKLSRQIHRIKVPKVQQGGSTFIFTEEKVGLAIGVKGSSYNAGADVVRKARSFGLTNVVLVKSELDVNKTAEIISGMIQANYRYKVSGTTALKHQEEEENQGRFTYLTELHLQQDLYDDQYLQELMKLAEYKLVARELANTRQEGTPQYFIHEVRKQFAGNPNVKITILEGDMLKENKLNLFHSVGKGSIHQPALINLHYQGNPESNDIYALIGKGVTFDTGGLHIKPFGSMEKMYLDKSGASNVLAAFKGAVEMNLPINITATLGMAENAVSGESYKPGEILTSHKGLTVEVNNTDAEGRLVLADCISWTQAKFKPIQIIEMSTLTGACAAALGENTGGIMTQNDELADSLIKLGNELQEPFWRLPVTEEHHEMMKGQFTDLCNVGKGKVCGAQKAAAFLMSFVSDNVPYAHLDIAGPMESKADKFINPLGATGFGTQVLLKYLINKSKQ